MKQTIIIIFRSLLLIACLFFFSVIYAYDFEVNGIYYDKISSNQVEVTYMLSQNKGYSGVINIPQSVKYKSVEYDVVSIGSTAFKGTKITKLTIPNSITKIGIQAFSGCTELKGNLIIPNSVITICEGAFLGCSGLTGSLVIPNSVKEIGSSAFRRCSGFTGSLVISNSVKKIGSGAFEECSGFTGSLTIPNSVETIESEAFEGCSGFTGSLIIPNSVKSIGESAFWKCNGLTGSLTIGNSVTSIGGTAFWNCNFTGSLTIPNSVQTIGNQAFENCVSFTGELTISSGGVGSNAFSGCTGFTTLNLLSNYMSGIGSNAFYRCRNITRVNSNILEPFEINGGVFDGISSDAILQIPKGKRSDYWNYGWNRYFKSVIEEGEVLFDITVSGNGWATYNGSSIRNSTETFAISEGASATITFNPDNGYRIKSVKVNNSTVSVSNNQCTISSISANSTVSVEFEAIPPTTYILSITASGSGSASYNGTVVRGKTSPFTVNEGANATITFTPDNGYRIKSVKVNNSAVIVTNNQYTISSINANTTVSVEFEAIPPTTYTLSITATGSGSASYNGTVVRGKTSPFTVNEGTNATITFTPDNGYRIKTVKVNSSAVTVANNQYTISNIKANTTVNVEFEAIPPTTYTLSITATGSGSASYNGTIVRGKTSPFTVNEGTNATITFTPDNGYRIKTVKVNNSAVTVTNNQYTVSNIRANTTISVEFETIPPTTYTLSITATGSGSASYDGTTIRSKTSSFTVNEGSNVSITITPDNGYRIKSVKENTTIVTSYVSNNKYSISSISRNTTVEIEFEAIPPTTCTLSITASGSGSASYNGTVVRGKTSPFTVNEGTNATITFTPDNGYRIKTVKVNNSAVTVTNNQYTISNIKANTTVSVEFEAIPPTTYTLSITATGSGSASYNGTVVRGKTSPFTVNEGANITIIFSPDDGYQIKSLKVNNVAATAQNNQYTISNINANTTVEVEFEAIINTFSVDNVNYSVVSVSDWTIHLASGNYGMVLEVPAKVSYQNAEWTVTGIQNGALADNTDLAAIIWNPEVAFTEQISNPNLLLYVNKEQYAPSSIQNVVVNGTSQSIILKDAANGNNFYCPHSFTAQRISYTHNYSMETGIGEAKGWETIALPFDVQKVTHQSKGEIVSFANWKSGDTKKPFWLMELNGSGWGWTLSESIKANTPYIISMPKNDEYKVGFWLDGNVTFSAENVMIPKTEDSKTANYGNRTFVPTFVRKDKSSGVLALNVINDIEKNTDGFTEGSTFVYNLRPVHPFEAYMTTTASVRSINIYEGMATGIKELIREVSDEGNIRIYNLNGQHVKTARDKKLEEVVRELPSGVYVVNGKKVIKSNIKNVR